jgi:hypothetical protein
MKKMICILAAASMLFAVGCSGRGNVDEDIVPIGSDEPAVTAPVSTQDAASTPAPVDIADENAVCFENGVFTRGAFNWNYFYAKTRAKMNAQVRILNARAGGTEDMLLKFENGAYVLVSGGQSARYGYLTGGTFDMPESSGYKTADVYILTDDAGMTVEAFFGGSIPADITLDYTTAAGRVIFFSFSGN